MNYLALTYIVALAVVFGALGITCLWCAVGSGDAKVAHTTLWRLIGLHVAIFIALVYCAARIPS